MKFEVDEVMTMMTINLFRRKHAISTSHAFVRMLILSEGVADS